MQGANFKQALTALREISDRQRPRNLVEAFAEDRDRALRFSVSCEDLTLDFSKCAVSVPILDALLELAEAARIEECREAMFRGEPVNPTEARAALHIALRAPPSPDAPPYGSAIARQVAAMLNRMEEFARGIRDGKIVGSAGRPFRTVVNIGIGGSDLGPAMTVQALRHLHDGPQLRFVANIDGAEIATALAGLDPATTLFIVASKTFTTIETMTNAATARNWIVDHLGERAVEAHFAAVSTAADRVAAFGMAANRMFGFWDWVGGRYSIWSAIGLPLMIAVGPEHFRRFLEGGHAMDRHFLTAAPRENLPLLLGLIGYWHRTVLLYPCRAIIPYDQRLQRLPAYLQQLDMESNGKRVALNGDPLTTPSGPVVWGEPGTNGQHAFFQWLHQGTDIVPVEFLLAALGDEPRLDHHHRLLVANCLAQSEALMRGRSREETEQHLRRQGLPADKARKLAPHRAFPGNRPSLTLLYRRLDPYTLGRLIALYEHRVFVEAALYGINPFDQWGVELGKELATDLLPVVEGTATGEGHDGSTIMLAERLRALRAAG